MTDFGAWTVEYLELVATRQKLEAFIEENYEHYLQTIAHEYFDAVISKLPGDRHHEPCFGCRVEVSTLIGPAAAGWYFEWNCRGGYTGTDCSASGEGWHVPLGVIAEKLAAHGIATTSST